MSNFFSNLVRGRPITAVQSLWVDEDVQELKDFLDKPPTHFYMQAALGVPLKKVVNDALKVLESRVNNPLGLQLGRHAAGGVNSKLTAAQVIRESGCVERVPVLIPEATAKKYLEAVELSEFRIVRDGGLVFTMPPVWIAMQPGELLAGTIRDASLDVRKKLGTFDKECPQCSEELYLDEDQCCSDCGYHILTESKSDIVDMYKEVIKYELDHDVTILERESVIT